MEELLKVLENVYKCPAVMLDEHEALNKIMETYRDKVR